MNGDIANTFGTDKYAREELRAEIFSVFMAAGTGLPMNDPAHFERHAAYVKGWVQALKDDKHEIFRAAKDAETMQAYVLSLEREYRVEHTQAPTPERAWHVGHRKDSWPASG